MGLTGVLEGNVLEGVAQFGGAVPWERDGSSSTEIQSSLSTCRTDHRHAGHFPVFIVPTVHLTSPSPPVSASSS